MMDTAAEIIRWRKGSEEDLAAARSLVEKGHLRQGLFFAHLAIEKILKAHVVRTTSHEAPKIHDLLRLADLGRAHVSIEQREVLAELQLYCLAGRYPDAEPEQLNKQIAQADLRRAEEIVRWLRNQLP